MNILHLSASDSEGGAGRAAYRLHRGLESLEINSQMLVRQKTHLINSVIAEKSFISKISPPISQLYMDKLYIDRLKGSSGSKFSPQWFPDRVISKALKLKPDIIHLHWICTGFIRIESLTQVRRPIVWTLHDMWPFTGGCHYTEGCTRYKNNCGLCPQLNSNQEHDLSAKVLSRKSRAWKSLNLTIVTPSQWLAQCTRESSLFSSYRIEVIPNGIDTSIFKPFDKKGARKLLNLPLDKKIVLFAAGNPTGESRKGFALLIDAFKILKQQEESNCELAVLGLEASKTLPEWSFKVHCLGRLKDEISLALAYCAADVFVAPSRQDNLPNTIVEALACGIPCVAFKIGGMPDLIEHRGNGYLAEPFDVVDLAKGIQWVLQDEPTYQNISSNARMKAEQNLSLVLQAKRFSSLYEELLV